MDSTPTRTGRVVFSLTKKRIFLCEGGAELGSIEASVLTGSPQFENRSDCVIEPGHYELSSCCLSGHEPFKPNGQLLSL